MQPSEVEQLRRQYENQYVVVDASQPELARFKGVGQIKTINMSGRALVQFLGADIGWYDIELDFLKIVDKPPEPEPVKKAPAAAAKKPAAKPEG